MVLVVELVVVVMVVVKVVVVVVIMVGLRAKWKPMRGGNV